MAFWRAWGVMRSLVMYYGIPGRAAQLRRFYSQFVQPGDVCFDVGAHVGNRVRALRQLGARVVAVEPQRDMLAVLRWLYGRDAKVTLVTEALGPQAGTATLLVSERTPTVSTLSQEWVAEVQKVPSFASVDWNAQQSVPVTTLDALITQYGLPAFCKIDVEGYELAVLEGLSQPIPALSVEFIPAARSVALGCVARLMTLGHYEFNWAMGERLQLQPEWQTSAAVTAWLNDQPLTGNSGDIYARWVREKAENE